MIRRLCTVLSLTCCAAFAADVSVTVIPGEAARDCVVKGELLASQANGPDNVSIPLERGKTSYALHLPKSGVWKVRVASSGCWSETAAWSAGDFAPIALHLFKAATIQAGIETPKQSRSSPHCSGEIYLQQGQPRTDALTGGSETSCTVAKSSWRCQVPGGVLFDIRLDAPGYASTFFWDVSVAANADARLGPVTLRPGASIAGWLQDPTDKPVKNGLVSCFPMEMAAGRRDHAVARIETVHTNSRGFFQCAGLREGRYRIVVDSTGLSPVAISDILVHPGESLVIPKPVRPSLLGEAEITFNPPLDRQGKPWRVELAEATRLDPSRERKVVTRTASDSGRLLAGGLRADLYSVEVFDSAGSPVERTTLDLFGGGRHTLNLNIRPFVVHGTVRAGDQPLKANLELSDTRGGFVKTSTDAEGHFETSLPAAGDWRVTVLYPAEGTAARIAAPALSIPDPLPVSPYDVTVQLPGGRIRGVVVGKKGEGGPAAVHARNGRTAAQQLTADDGKFDLIGLAAGTYQLDAQNDSGMTPMPVEVRIDDSENREITLVTEPTLRLSGFVATPDGRPASGAVVRISTNAEPRWATRVADVRGHFEYTASRATTAAQVVVVTYDYPIAFVTVPIREDDTNEQRIQLHNDGGVVRVRGSGGIYISARGVVAPMGILTYSQYVRRPDGGAYVESGEYTICQGRGAGACRNVTVTPGSEHDLDLNANQGDRNETRSHGTD